MPTAEASAARFVAALRMPKCSIAAQQRHKHYKTAPSAHTTPLHGSPTHGQQCADGVSFGLKPRKMLVPWLSAMAGQHRPARFAYTHTES